MLSTQESDDNNDDPEEIWLVPNVSEAVIAGEVSNMFMNYNFGDETMRRIMSSLHNAFS